MSINKKQHREQWIAWHHEHATTKIRTAENATDKVVQFIQQVNFKEKKEDSIY